MMINYWPKLSMPHPDKYIRCVKCGSEIVFRWNDDLKEYECFEGYCVIGPTCLVCMGQKWAD